MDPFDALAAKFEPAIAAALLRAFQILRDRYTLDQISAVIQARGPGGVYDLLRGAEAVIASELVPELEAAIAAAGRGVGAFLPPGLETTPITLQLTVPAAAAYVQQYTFELITRVTTETVEAVRDAVADAIATGRPPADIARDFRHSLGLTSTLERAAENYRKALEGGDAATAAQYQLRDKRFKVTGTLPKEQIDKMVERYKERAINYRADTISRTESMRAISIGQDMAIRQTEGLGEQLDKQWLARQGDGRTRDAHIATNRQVVAFDQKFQTPLGPLQFPRDPNGSAANTINCRCRVRYVRRQSGG